MNDEFLEKLKKCKAKFEADKIKFIGLDGRIPIRIKDEFAFIYNEFKDKFADFLVCYGFENNAQGIKISKIFTSYYFNQFTEVPEFDFRILVGLNLSETDIKIIDQYIDFFLNDNHHNDDNLKKLYYYRKLMHIYVKWALQFLVVDPKPDFNDMITYVRLCREVGYSIKDPYFTDFNTYVNLILNRSLYKIPKVLEFIEAKYVEL
jgi:hypothetical protein